VNTQMMSGAAWVRLGAGKATRQGTGNKGALLDQAKRAGINVPRGVLLLDTIWDQAVLTGLLVIDGKTPTFPDPERFLTHFRIPKFGRPLAIRSAFSAEDNAERSMAGYFESVLNVDQTDPAAIAAALVTVLQSAFKSEQRVRRDVLIMEMVEAVHAGVAFTECEHEDDLINYTTGTAQDLVGGKVEGETMPLAKLRHFESVIPGETVPDWANRLQVILRQVRRWMGQRDWDVEWADDGKTCYLVQLRPVTRPTRRDEAFTIANHKEILPELPSTLMTSVIASCAPDLFQYYRNFDASLPESRPFIEVFHGRPYINLSLMTEMMRVFGLPTRLVTDNIGGQENRPYGLNVGRMLRKTLSFTLPRFAFAQLLSVRSVQRRTRELLTRTESLPASFVGLVEELRWLYTALVTEMFSLTAAIGPMLLLLRQTGTLAQHSARQQTISTRMYTDLDPLRDYVLGQLDWLKQLRADELPNDRQLREMWNDYMADYAHRGIYESDIARPRYRDDPSPLLRSLTGRGRERVPKPSRTLRGWLTLPIWWQAGRTMRAREQWRHDCMIGFDRVRRLLVQLAKREVQRGALPTVDHLWMLTVDEVKRLDTGWLPDAAFWEDRQTQIDRLKSYDLPDLFRRSDDLEQFRETDGQTHTADHISGVSLTTGTATGRAWVLNEPEVDLPDGFDQDSTILIARSVDAGWIATFSQVAGVVVETGGDLSHGSIILREIGLPAITNAHQATRQFRTGDAVNLNAGAGLVQRQSSA